MGKFLVIDDDPIILQITSAFFKAKGHQVVTARDGKEGIHKFETDRFDLVITDLMMPKTHGYQVIDHIKKTQKGKLTPVILLTADQNEPELDQYDRNKFQDDTLTKPFDIPILEKMVNDLMDEFEDRRK